MSKEKNISSKEKVYILNSAIITAYGKFEYEQMTIQQVRRFLEHREFVSAIGHEATARVVSTLIERNCPMNRIVYTQEVGEQALVFKLNQRIPEGAILGEKQINEIGYHWGLLTRIT